MQLFAMAGDAVLVDDGLLRGRSFLLGESASRDTSHRCRVEQVANSEFQRCPSSLATLIVPAALHASRYAILDAAYHWC